jgi:hypothetical protein
VVIIEDMMSSTSPINKQKSNDLNLMCYRKGIITIKIKPSFSATAVVFLSVSTLDSFGPGGGRKGFLIGGMWALACSTS